MSPAPGYEAAPNLESDAGLEDAPKASSGNIFAADVPHQVATAAREAASSGVRRAVAMSAYVQHRLISGWIVG